MRAQPPHFGHVRLIKRFRHLAQGKVVVFLCRDFDENKNPFSFNDRREWFGRLLVDAGVTKVLIPNRLALPRLAEYSSHFQGEFHVVVTDETLCSYERQGFKMINHLAEGFWPASDNYPLPTHSNARVVRQLIRAGGDVNKYMPHWLADQVRRKLT